jgi:hypothetical protein
MIYEYHCCRIADASSEEHIEKMLNTKGADRWELVSVVEIGNYSYGRHYFFKRPLLR